jgi:hypothetical protein
MSGGIRVGPGPGCTYCGGVYGKHDDDCPRSPKPTGPNEPRRFRGRSKDGTIWYGCYFPGTDLMVTQTGKRGTGEPHGVEWIDDQDA